MCKKRVVILSVLVLFCMILSITGSSFALALPNSLDWRDYKGENNVLQPTPGNYVTSVKTQDCGDCWAFGTTAALESRILIRNNMPGVDLDLSEQVLKSCANAGACYAGDTTEASNFFLNTGLPEETCYPYSGTNGDCSAACLNWQNNTYKIFSWAYVAHTVNDLKKALYYYGPVVCAMPLHSVLTVGYNDTGQYFIVKNSWGTDWGEEGYFRIAYSEVDSLRFLPERNLLGSGLLYWCIGVSCSFS